jgi:hypothetical protein
LLGSTLAHSVEIVAGGYIVIPADASHKTKDVNLRGIHMDSTEFVGQYDGVDQIVIGVDGKLKAGAGKIVLDNDGITIKGAANTDLPLQFKKDDGTYIGQIAGYYTAVGTAVSVLVEAQAAAGAQGCAFEINALTSTGAARVRMRGQHDLSDYGSWKMQVWAAAGAAGHRIEADATSDYILMDPKDYVMIGPTGARDLRVRGGVTIGSTLVDPAAGELRAKQVSLNTYATNPSDTSRVQAAEKADIASFTLTVVVPQIGCDVLVGWDFVTWSTDVNYGFHLYLMRDATELREWRDVTRYIGTGRHMIGMTYLDRNVAAGTYVYKLQWAASGGTGHTTYAYAGHIYTIVTGVTL